MKSTVAPLRVRRAKTFGEAIALVEEFRERASVLLCDLDLGDSLGDGNDVLSHLIKLEKGAPGRMKVIITTASTAEKVILDVRARCHTIMRKPFDLDRYLDTINKILGK